MHKHKAVARLMLLCALFLIASAAWIPADASVSRMKWQSGTPSQPPPRPPIIGPSAPPDGGAPIPGTGCTGCPSFVPE